MNNIGVFLDRDGTINEEVDFLSSPNHVRLIPGSAEGIHLANELGFKVFIVTNQSGIARGLFTEDQVSKIHQTLLQKLENRGAHIDGIFYCPHHPENGKPPYRKDCGCRKPNTGMLSRAAKEYNVNLKKSFVVGDKMIDIQTGNNAGATSILVLTGYGKQELELCHQNKVHIDYVASDLLDAMKYIKRIGLKEQPQITQ
ncbi:MAG: D-glycero-beta-D-manno-heptose 1,7-bisphosphate 7-phosphatase [Ignavibacteriae bacterium]|nr:D-glycero-beta-D-manno-heptose 1,7-bisphosphate 7-phosphatase [Ignavibacteriota bacterium]